ncbi:MAG TPA: bifunctional diaminohydroxyphosphoribosylaminopyrimidine deaminase/5-amino-6-(5-phosphoribosylamino)uracil reductase RibD [Polyangiaceae bacterium]|nr:bifunctional diaminohydroxyphosphoribosylaminopyrimidine deaminase/5-amino-6-(5-phosphoribosylamino)uracil reductase RibD [Polyangiaceae bacterium]
MMADLDAKMMNRALELARLGDPSPNPHVGCVVAQGTEIVGEGHHESAGREHAEVVAIQAAGERTKGATLYVTLEPCNHHGRTPPCVEKILQAQIARVVIGCRDPNPTVTGNGLERLKAAGVAITSGCLEAECRQLILPWTKYVTQQRSFLALKLAVSLDGRIATRTGASKWITCPESRARVHELRGAHDAVMVGINTVHSDDPRLTVRDVPGRNPIRIVVDSKLRMPMTSHLVATARDIPTCIVTTQEASRAVGDSIEAAGISLIRVPGTAEGRCDMLAALTELAAREVVSVLCEGGAELAGSLLAAGLVDAMHVFVAPILLGPRGRPGAVDWAGPESPADAPRIDKPRWELCGADAYVSGSLIYPKRTSRA